MIGFDIGSQDLVCCKQEQDNYIYNVEQNIYAAVNNKLLISLFKDKLPLVEKDNKAYILGESVLELANSMKLEIKKPLQGFLNKSEKNSFQILSTMIHGLIEDLNKDNEVLFYTSTTNEEYKNALKMIFNTYESSLGYKIYAIAVNKGAAVVAAETDTFTGLGIHFGSSFVHMCEVSFKTPIFTYTLGDCGEWIDRQAAKVLKESPSFINEEKKKVNLLDSGVIQNYYTNIIDRTVETLNSFKINYKEMPVIIAGGTSLAINFDILLAKKLGIERVTRSKDALYAASRGCLNLAKN